MLDDFSDVSREEKMMMHAWNCFARQQRCADPLPLLSFPVCSLTSALGWWAALVTWSNLSHSSASPQTSSTSEHSAQTRACAAPGELPPVSANVVPVVLPLQDCCGCAHAVGKPRLCGSAQGHHRRGPGPSEVRTQRERFRAGKERIPAAPRRNMLLSIAHETR